MTRDEAVARFRECGDEEVSTALTNALDNIFAHDRYLLENAVHERTLAACFAWYLKPGFDGWHVDPEYNKHGADSKRVRWRAAEPTYIVPDIIVHQRGPEGPNRLAIEVKTDPDANSEDDVLKLQGMRNDLAYAHALFIHFGVKERAGEIIDCGWV